MGSLPGGTDYLTSYIYNSYLKVATKTDAIGQQTQYSYDSLARLTQVRHYPNGSGQPEDTCQQVNYYYDYDYSGGFSSNVSGRLAAIVYKNSSCDTTFYEFYSYNSGGVRTGKRVSVYKPNAFSPANLDSTYEYDTEGRMTSQVYPSWYAPDSYGNPTVLTAGVTLGYTYDNMGRLSTLTENGSTNIISSTTYGPAGELQAMSGAWGSEGRSYNAMLQMTYLSSGSVTIGYNYSSTQNNGKIVSQHDYVSGEDISYTYDSLNRLATAQTADPTWGQSYGYDGFGNLTDVTTTKGSIAELHTFYGADNRPSCADANGNYGACAYNYYGYDVENRMISNGWQGTLRYGYAPDNKRVWKGVWSGGTQTVDELTFWSVTGQRAATYNLRIYGGGVRATQTGTEYYFGGKLVKNAGGYVHADRLGSIGKYYPYGQERPSATANGTEKFATYFRDSETGLDYAENRFYQPGVGRFMTKDPWNGSGKPDDPGSWNRYAYVKGDPVNSKDPHGLEGEGPDYCDLYPDDPNCYPFRCPNGICGPDPGTGVCDYYLCNFSWLTVNGPLGNAYSTLGMNNARDALTRLSTADLSKCSGLLNSVGQSAPTKFTTGDLQAEAAVAADYVYDGASSPTTFSSTGSSLPGTIGQVFSQAGSGIIAYSQGGGHAIWVRSETFASSRNTTMMYGLYEIMPAFADIGGPTNYALASVLHEIMHKFGLGDAALADALGVRNADFAALGSVATSNLLYDKCFSSKP